ncbi:TPA: DNA distortion polypeptide 3 [Escherichia coli]|nr:DNA distortion polypeptide 3 [Escherichia coli]
MTYLTPFRNVCPVTYSRFLLERVMKYQVKEFINEKYSKAVNILKDNLKEHYHIFYGLRLSEILFPASEYGSEMFFQEFEAINSVILPLVIFDLIDRKPIMVIGFGEVCGVDSLVDSGIEVVSLDGLSDLLLVEKLTPLFN